MSLWTLCEKVVEATKAKFPNVFAQGDAFGGDFTLAEAMRHSKRLPAFFVTVQRTTEDRPKGGHRAYVALVVVTKSTTAEERSPLVMRLVSAVLAWLPGQTFGYDKVVYGAEEVESRNLYGASADAKGVALWVITWVTVLDLDDEDDPDLPPATIHAEWDLENGGDPIEKVDEIDLQE